MTDLPRQNRVDPFGELVSTPERGTLFGNRGVLHDDDGRIIRRHQLKRWIYCRLEYKGWRRQLMQPGRYTELFFLDEATALAAGHRPCAECMRERFNEFRTAWGDAGVRAPEIDEALHAERLTPTHGQATHRAFLSELPDGVVVEIDGAPFLWRGNALLRWSFAGYGATRAAVREEVAVLTPPSTVKVIAAGFEPYFGA
jgi:hypothetical protein